jgi:uncharacterized membrane protein YkvA (DUF1232 family)
MLKFKTLGVDPKVPIQALVTLAIAALAYFGIDLSPEVSGAIGVIVGIIVAALGPAPATIQVPAKPPR